MNMVEDEWVPRSIAIERLAAKYGWAVGKAEAQYDLAVSTGNVRRDAHVLRRPDEKHGVRLVRIRLTRDFLSTRPIFLQEHVRVEWNDLVAQMCEQIAEPRPTLSAGFRTSFDEKAEHAGHEWLADYVARWRKGEVERPRKEEARELIIASVGALSGEAFRRVWEKAAPPEWKMGGRIPRNK